MFIDPRTPLDRVESIAQNYTVPDDFAVFRDVHQCELVGLRYVVQQNEAGDDFRTLRNVMSGYSNIIAVSQFHVVSQNFSPL